MYPPGLISQEVFRWRPVSKLGQNHYVTEDNWYKGYFIPKNTIIMLNLWALHYDEDTYPEPEKVSTLFVYTNGGSSTLIDFWIILSPQLNTQRILMFHYAIISALAEDEESALASMLQKIAYSSTSPVRFGVSILNMPKISMGTSCLLTSLRRDFCPELWLFPNRLNAVIHDYIIPSNWKRYHSAQCKTRENFERGMGGSRESRR